MSEGNKVILLDRDGVLNRDRSNYVRTPQQLQILPGVPAAVSRLTQAGYRVLIITNQACVGKGLLSSFGLEKIHEKLRREVSEVGGRIDGIYHCPHTDEFNCDCRKPKPGLILKARKEWGFLPEQTWFVGDTTRDMAAARAAGCLGALVLTGQGEMICQQVPDHPHFRDLADFVSSLLG
ncbi:MAG: D-glycero-beta-D-manno-heptose 1,7-bisphosphate 7-phosphatase [Magnetococcales bacterium]|nr:D-glycero-beta-D-manno-heptose 1,7-bisphosphate 7-phosphatase [Magnetococcales bacterium]